MQTGKVIPKLLIVLILAGSGGWWYWSHSKATAQANSNNTGEAEGGKKRRGFGGSDNRPSPVLAERVKTGDIRIIQTALGTVTPSAVVTLTSRVNGQLTRILFKEGQFVHAGELLAELDARPFQAALGQVQGQAARNLALLHNSQIDLDRYKSLEAEDAVAYQQLDSQASLVQQYKGTVQADQGLVDNAKLQVSFTRITSPVNGRIGLRQVDAGNNITTANTIAVINTVDPIHVVFTLPEDRVYELVKSFQASKNSGKDLVVEAWDRANTKLLAKGFLLSLDNQIDTTSGTVKLKAQFSNKESTLFPNQFVNVRLLSDTLRDVTVVPNLAIQHGSAGAFVYKIARDKNNTFKDGANNQDSGKTLEPSKLAVNDTPSKETKETPKDTTAADGKAGWPKNGKRGGNGGRVSNVKVQTVQLGAVDGDYVQVLDGLRPGDQVVVSGIEKLKDNAKVTVTRPENPEYGSGRQGRRGLSGDNAADTNSESADNASQRHRVHGEDGANQERGKFKHSNKDTSDVIKPVEGASSSLNKDSTDSKSDNIESRRPHRLENAIAPNAENTKTDASNAENGADDNARKQRRAGWAKKFGADGAHQRPEGSWKHRNADGSDAKSASNEAQ